MTDERLERFVGHYSSGHTPWDTGITPPEIEHIAAELPPGKAIDLGCGTGTNVGYLLQKGWQVDGIDFVPQAIEIARTKLSAFPAEQFSVVCCDVTRLDECPGLRPPYDLAVDIGCGHGLPLESQAKYARDISDLLAPGGTMMLFCHEPTEERPFGWMPEDVHRLFLPYFDLVWQALNPDTTTGSPSGWYRLAKRV